MSNIKIFVSHRIDINSELIDNSIYYPVRCGATFDKENVMNIAGDDTKDNISDKRMSFCEFTVQYWAWKNMECDYYGLCHYRRFLSFSDRRFKTNDFNMIHVPNLTDSAKKRYELLNEDKIHRIISENDIVVSEYANVPHIRGPQGVKHTVEELWYSKDGVFFEKSSVELMFKLIDEFAPQYSGSAHEYFAGNLHRGFNCYVLKKELFNRLCEFQFPIMFEIEHRINTNSYTQTMLRTPAFIGEMLYGIFIYHITKYEHWKVKEVQLVFFSNTERIKGKIDLIKRTVWSFADKVLRAILDPVLPKWSKRRELLKKIFYKFTPAKQRGEAKIEDSAIFKDKG